MVTLVEKLPDHEQAQKAPVQLQYAFALNRRNQPGDRNKALAILEKVCIFHYRGCISELGKGKVVDLQCTWVYMYMEFHLYGVGVHVYVDWYHLYGVGVHVDWYHLYRLVDQL